MHHLGVDSERFLVAVPGRPQMVPESKKARRQWTNRAIIPHIAIPRNHQPDFRSRKGSKIAKTGLLESILSRLTWNMPCCIGESQVDRPPLIDFSLLRSMTIPGVLETNMPHVKLTKAVVADAPSPAVIRHHLHFAP